MRARSTPASRPLAADGSATRLPDRGQRVSPARAF
jgi:hypothetical protein